MNVSTTDTETAASESFPGTKPGGTRDRLRRGIRENTDKRTNARPCGNLYLGLVFKSRINQCWIGGCVRHSRHCLRFPSEQRAEHSNRCIDTVQIGATSLHLMRPRTSHPPASTHIDPPPTNPLIHILRSSSTWPRIYTRKLAHCAIARSDHHSKSKSAPPSFAPELSGSQRASLT